MKSSISHSVALALWLLNVVSPVALAGQSIQPGFYSHESTDINISISEARSGELCADPTGVDSVCSIATKLTVKGADTCLGDDGRPYPCTRYGYRYDFEGATPGTEIRCEATQNDGFNKRQKEYSKSLDSDSGNVFQPEWIKYGPVERRTMLTEVHECSYLGAPLATIEYIITYEPSANPAPRPSGGPNPAIDEPFIGEVPRACLYLTPDIASGWVRDAEIQDGGSANEHLPILRSHCQYTAIHAAERDARLELRYQLYDLYNVEKLSRAELVLHATFAGGGYQPQDVLDNLGKISFVYDMERDVTVLMVITGMQGPPDGASRPMEFTASYYLRDPGRTHNQRLLMLIEFASRNLESWKAEY